MGLCRCRKVSNLYCFNDRVPVCDTCVVESHEICVVDSYLAWVQDSDFEWPPKCKLCDEEIQKGNSMRLMCMHTFHPKCIEALGESLPAHTALAGYACPTCQKPIVPPDSVTTPLAEQVRRWLDTFPWAARLRNLSAAPAESNGDGGRSRDGGAYLTGGGISQRTNPGSANFLVPPSSSSSSSSSLPSSSLSLPSSSTATHGSSGAITQGGDVAIHMGGGGVAARKGIATPTAHSSGHSSSIAVGEGQQQLQQKQLHGSQGLPRFVDDDDDKYRKRGGLLQLLFGRPAGASGLTRGQMSALFTVFTLLLVIVVLHFHVKDLPAPTQGQQQ